MSLTGRSGSGKTTLGRYLMARSKMKWVVLDTKHDSGFDKAFIIDGLPDAKKIMKAWEGNDLVVIRPSPMQNVKEVLDPYINYLHESLDNFGLFIDEAYQVAFGPNPGPGLVAVVTRGRVRGQSVIVGSQRPSWIPKFCFSEANYFAVMSLNTLEDREKIYSFIGNEEVLKKQPPRKFWWYDVGDDELTPFGAVTLKEVKNASR